MKTVLITGARRIGAYIARHLHGIGMDVIIHYNTAERSALQLAKELNRLRSDSAITLQADLANHTVLESFFSAALQFKKKVDVLINNAAIFYPTPIDEITNSHWEEIININLKAPLFLSLLFARQDIKPSTIINIADIHAERPLKEHPVYSISQAGMLMLTQAMAIELGPDIRVNAISPGAILWPKDTVEENKKSILKKVALKKTGVEADIANAIYFLIEQADYMTGQNIIIDGGRTLYS